MTCFSAAFAEFGVLPKKNHFLTHLDELKKNVADMAAGKMEPTVPIISQSQVKMMEEILRQEIEDFGKVYERLYQCAVQIMRVHAPQNVSPMVDNVVSNTLFFHTVGLIGACGVKSEKLAVPQDDLPAAVMIVADSKM